jgi:retron-type reverse transcriptase
MTRGVKQGDPLSTLLLNLAMDPLLEAILAQNNDYKWDESGLQLEARLCFLWHASPVIYLDAKVFSSVSWCY